jgi:hypothetical protein
VYGLLSVHPMATLLKSGFTPLTFVGVPGQKYKISIANYDGKIFQRWEDASSSDTRTIDLTQDTTITATYDTGKSLRGFTPLTYAGTPEQPNLTVVAKTLDGNELPHMWAIIDPQSSTTSTSGTEATYKVYATNGYKDLVFDHWGDNGNIEL